MIASYFEFIFNNYENGEVIEEFYDEEHKEEE